MFQILLNQIYSFKKIKKFKGHEIFNISSNKKITLKN